MNMCDSMKDELKISKLVAYFLFLFGIFFILYQVFDFNNFQLEGIINVKNYGVKGDGITDDWDALQDIINKAPEGSIIYFPNSDGNYLISKPLCLKSDITIQAEKNVFIESISTIKEMKYIFLGDEIENITIKDIGLTKMNNDSSTIKFRNSSHIMIDDIVIKNEDPKDSEPLYSQGISLLETNNVKILNSHFINTRGHCIVVGTFTQNPSGECENIQILNNTFEDYGRDEGSGMAIDISGGYEADDIFYVKDVVISNNIFKNGQGNGVKLQLCENVIFSNNIIDRNNGTSLIINAQNKPINNISCYDNIITNSEIGIGILYFSLNEDAQSIIIKDNIIKNNVYANIFIKNAGGKVIIDNNCLDNHKNNYSIVFEETYSDKGEYHITANDIVAEKIGVLGIPYKLKLSDNEINANSRGVKGDIEEHKGIHTNQIIVSDNIFKGSSSIPFYIRKENIDEIYLTDNFFEQSISAPSCIFIRKPYDDQDVNTIMKIGIIENNILLPNNMTYGIQLELDNLSLSYASIKNNKIMACSKDIIEENDCFDIDGNITLHTKEEIQQ